jgi:3-oxoacyl-[acyl-carrier-protein] synthase II
MVERCEVVITGVGPVSPIGIGREAFWDSLLAGRSGIAPLSAVLGTDLRVQFGGEVKDFDGKQFVKPRKSMKVMSREIQIGYAATMLAVADAGLSKGDVDPDRMGAVLGAGDVSLRVGRVGERLSQVRGGWPDPSRTVG